MTAVFAGHLHRNSEAAAGTLQVIATSAVGKPLGKDPSGFRVVKVYADRIEHAYYALDAVPERIDLAGPTTRPDSAAGQPDRPAATSQPTAGSSSPRVAMSPRLRVLFPLHHHRALGRIGPT